MLVVFLIFFAVDIIGALLLRYCCVVFGVDIWGVLFGIDSVVGISADIIVGIMCF